MQGYDDLVRTFRYDAMILSVLFDTMIRADELIRISMGDICLNAGIPYILIHGKGNKERTVSISEKVVPLIRAYMKEFHGSPAEDTDFPFIYTVSHGAVHRMSERNLERIVKKYADITRQDYPSLPDPVYPHMLRRTRGTGLYRDGVPIEAIASHHWNRSGQQWKKGQVSSHREARNQNGLMTKTSLPASVACGR